MKKLAIFATLTLAVIAANSAFAGDIYKWTDADGNNHYGDRPTGEQSERVAIASRATDPARIQQATQARADSRTAKAEAAATAAAAGPSEEEMQAQAAERAKRCTSSKAQMQQLVTSRRLYREDDKGERIYLDESESLAARERVENQITEFCSS
jgi:hypothetical protein